VRVCGAWCPLENNYYTEMCSAEAGSYLRRIDFVYHSTLGLEVIKKKVSASRLRGGVGWAEENTERRLDYRGTSLIRNSPPP